MADFGEESIDIRYNTDLWGVFKFDFEPCLPDGAVISSVAIKAYQGNVGPKSTLSEETEIATLVDDGYVPTISNDTEVNVKFQYPGDSYKGQKATVIFEITTSAAAVHPFYFKYLKIR